MNNLLSALLLVLISASVLQAQRLLPEGWNEMYIFANGIRQHYFTAGNPENTPMIFSHGFSDDAIAWDGIASELADDFFLVMYDARHHGYSDSPTGEQSLQDQVEDLIALVEALELDKPIAMGHSMGGGTVLMAAAWRPDLFRAVVLEDPVGLLDWVELDDEQTEEKQREVHDMIYDWNRQTYGDLKKIASEGYHKNWSDRDHEIWAHGKKHFHPNMAYVDRKYNLSFKEAFEKLTVPALILRADVDAETRERDKELVSLAADAEIVYVEGAGHNLRRDDKEQTMEFLLPFLMKHK